MIYFIGAGPGAADLITVKGKDLLEKADLIIYAGSLVNPELLKYAKPECVIMDSAKMTLEGLLQLWFRQPRPVNWLCGYILVIRVFMVLIVNR